MRYEFCTLFDGNYLPRGLVLYRSLAEVCDEFRLRVFCMDTVAKAVLDRLSLPGVVAVALDELEAHDRGLTAVKAERSPVEYMWTATPAVCRYALEREPEIGSITYLDADLMFFHDPAPLFEELAEGSVLIVPHRYTARYEALEALSGIYNVQFMTFRRTESGLHVLHRWHEQCLEWCFNRHEDGRFGDQKYLDDWPESFPGVHVLRHPGGGLAPWNAADYAIEARDGMVLIGGRPLVFYHFHALRLHTGITALRRLGLLAGTYRLARDPLPLVWRTDYELTEPEVQLIWEPYVHRLAEEVGRIRSVEPHFAGGFTRIGARDAAIQLARETLPRPVRAGLRRALSLVR